MPIHMEQLPNGCFIAQSTEFTLVETSTGWARALAEHPDQAVCMKFALNRAQAVEAGTFNGPTLTSCATQTERHHQGRKGASCSSCDTNACGEKRQINRLLACCAWEGAPLGILTDGLRWRLFLHTAGEDQRYSNFGEIGPCREPGRRGGRSQPLPRRGQGGQQAGGQVVGEDPSGTELGRVEQAGHHGRLATAGGRHDRRCRW